MFWPGQPARDHNGIDNGIRHNMDAEFQVNQSGVFLHHLNGIFIQPQLNLTLPGNQYHNRTNDQDSLAWISRLQSSTGFPQAHMPGQQSLFIGFAECQPFNLMGVMGDHFCFSLHTTPKKIGQPTIVNNKVRR